MIEEYIYHRLDVITQFHATWNAKVKDNLQRVTETNLAYEANKYKEAIFPKDCSNETHDYINVLVTQILAQNAMIEYLQCQLQYNDLTIEHEKAFAKIVAPINAGTKKHINNRMILDAKKEQKIQQAKKGGDAKNAIFQPLKDLAKELVNQKHTWPSRRNAALTIRDKILAEAIAKKIPLSEQQAETTITGWLADMGLPANIVR